LNPPDGVLRGKVDRWGGSAERTLSVREICTSSVERGGADINAAAMEHAVELFHTGR
jgi:hypothetical protein